MMCKKFFVYSIIFFIFGCSGKQNISTMKSQIKTIIPFIPKDEETVILLDTAKIGKARPYYENGKNAEKNGLADKAINEYLMAINIAPDYFDALYALGNIYQAKGFRENALETYKKALKYKPESAEIYNETGNIYKDLNRFDEAILEYERAIILNPSFSAAYNNLGLIYSTRKYMPDKAVQYYLKVIDLNNDLRILSIAHYQLGIIYYFKGKEPLAINHYKKSIEKFSDYAPPYFKLGEIYMRQSKKEEAVRNFEQYLRLADPKSDLAEDARRYLRKLR